MRTALRSTFLAFLPLLVIAGCRDGGNLVEPADTALSAQASSAGQNKIVYVAPPTGDPATDVANIAAAFAAAGRNSTIQFAAGTYFVGNNPAPIRVDPKGVSLVGHVAGTTIEGGTVVSSRVPVGFQLRGKQQSVRGITFNSFGAAVVVGFANPDEGGYSITDCTFTESYLPIQASHATGQVTRISGNRFVNVFIPIQTLGDRFEFSWNTLSVPDPSRIPVFGRPGNAGQFNSAFIGVLGRALNAEHNVIEHNTVDDYPDGYILASFPNSAIRGTIVRNNLHRNANQYVPQDGGSFVVPESLGGVTEDNLIIGNTLIGAEGWGMFVWNSHGNRIIGNTIRDVRVRPLSGADGGVAIWLLGSDRAHVLNNYFDANATVDVQLDGDDNLVVLREAADVVLDNGQNNAVVGVGQSMVAANPSSQSARVARVGLASVDETARHLRRKAQASAAADSDDPLEPDVAIWWEGP